MPVTTGSVCRSSARGKSSTDVHGVAYQPRLTRKIVGYDSRPGVWISNDQGEVWMSHAFPKFAKMQRSRIVSPWSRSQADNPDVPSSPTETMCQETPAQFRIA